MITMNKSFEIKFSSEAKAEEALNKMQQIFLLSSSKANINVCEGDTEKEFVLAVNVIRD